MSRLLIRCAAALFVVGIVAGQDALAQSQSVVTGGADEPAGYMCPMHPEIVSDDPQARCPICGMDLEPIAAAPIEGAIAVAPQMLQTMGVRSARAQVTNFDRSIRAFGHVRPNERLESVAVSRVEGWIESLAVRAAGEEVEEGALLYRVYSAELIGAQKDWLNARASGNEARIAGASSRLRSIGMQQQAIDQLARKGQVIERVPVYAEATGTVAFLGARDGDYVKPGTLMLRLQSYDSVWVIASIPEQDLALIREGQDARLRFPSAPGETLTAPVDYVYPTIDPKTRTVDVRITVENARGRILPGAYADVELQVDIARRLSVPSESILRDSRGAHVIVAFGEGQFAGRDVVTGLSSDGRTEIREGLAEGERVVVSGQFMLDSEVSLREGLSKLLAPTATPPATEHDHGTHR